jgi:hypothetical protein
MAGIQIHRRIPAAGSCLLILSEFLQDDLKVFLGDMFPLVGVMPSVFLNSAETHFQHLFCRSRWNFGAGHS